MKCSESADLASAFSAAHDVVPSRTAAARRIFRILVRSALVVFSRLRLSASDTYSPERRSSVTRPRNAALGVGSGASVLSSLLKERSSRLSSLPPLLLQVLSADALWARSKPRLRRQRSSLSKVLAVSLMKKRRSAA